MKAIIGLGNPGLKYRETRHNIGYMVVDYLAHFFLKEFVSTSDLYKLAVIKYSGEDLLLVKPLTYMNLSGIAVKEVVEKYQLQKKDLLVIVDDFQLPFGSLRVRKKGSDGGHNGLKSIIECLEAEAFTRLRMGIGRPDMSDVIDFVLSPFTVEENKLLDSMILESANAAKDWVHTDLQTIMNKYNKISNELGG